MTPVIRLLVAGPPPGPEQNIWILERLLTVAAGLLVGWWVWLGEQPDAVMIWFSGPSEERIWHCDYTNSVLGTLAFDC
jgi:hypothetical protein